MPNDNDTKKIDPQKLLQEMNKANEEAKKSLQEIDRQIAEVDLEYAKMLIKDDLDTLKIVKQILEGKLDILGGEIISSN